MNALYSTRPVAAPPRSRRAMVTSSALLHAALATAVVYGGATTSISPATGDRQSLTFVNVAAPLEPPRPIPPAVRLPPPKELAALEPPPSIPVLEELPLPAPIEEARIEPVRPEPAPEPVLETAIVERPKPLVQVGAFASATAATQTIPSRTVDQAGFDRTEHRLSDRARAGVTDAGFGTGTAAGPAGAGRGRVVAAAGFDSEPGGDSRTRVAHTVKTTDFDSRDAPPPAPKTPAEARNEIPVEILSKPTPAYTDEARALKIEGEVILDVEFGATGDIRVHQVMRGLGHGLDEMATRAVRGMRFTPARRNGQPVAVRTTVTIVFRLT